MIHQIKRHRCSSPKIVRISHNHSPQYLCRECGACRVLNPKPKGYSQEVRERVLRAYLECMSIRGST